MKVDQYKIQQAVKMILEAIGEDVLREGLLETPERVARMYEDIFSGLSEDPKEHCRTVFSEQHEELIVVKDITVFSMCEHHLVPFYGKAHIGYIPKDGRVIGLSKLVRVIESIVKRPQLQERITSTVANIVMEQLEPRGVIFVMEAEHMCMTMRGVHKPGTKTLTSAVRGVFENDSTSRMEALKLIGIG